MMEDDDDDHITGLEIQERSSPQHEEYKYEVLNANEIVESMVSTISEVNSVVQLNTTVTRILLNHFQWDKEKLYERIFDGSRVALFKEAKIIDTEVFQSAQSNSTIYHTTTTTRCKQKPQTCPICYTDKDPLIGLGCGHVFCRNCWNMYLSTKIMEEAQSGRITCAALHCNMLIDDQTVLTLVSDRRVKLRYQQLITNSYVECNRQMRWCPKPECGHAIKVSYPEFQPVKCVCGTKFCFLCGDSWHEPVKCNLIRKWKKKCDDDRETSHWIVTNTKECPKCHITIEKNGGCNHMVCKNTECKAEFCWVCLGAWQHHGSAWYNCNRYDESDAQAARDAQEKSRALLQRYLFYCKRYMNHMASLKFENKLYASIKEKMRDMQNHNMSWIEAKSNQTMIFEDNQRDLESATETLSEYLERDISSAEDIRDMKQKVQDKYRYCSSRRKILLEHVHEGYEQGWWVMIEN